LSKNWTVHFKGKKHIDKFSISMRLKTGILINKRQTYIEKIFPPSVNYINMKYTRYIPFLTQLYYIYLCVWVSVLWNIYFSKCGLRGMADIVVAFDLMTWPEPPDVWRKGDGGSTCSFTPLPSACWAILNNVNYSIINSQCGCVHVTMCPSNWPCVSAGACLCVRDHILRHI